MFRLYIFFLFTNVVRQRAAGDITEFFGLFFSHNATLYEKKLPVRPSSIVYQH